MKRILVPAAVQTELIGTSAEPSGSAVIFVLPNGENTIAISPGANGDVPLTHIEFSGEGLTVRKIQCRSSKAVSSHHFPMLTVSPTVMSGWPVWSVAK